MHPEQEPISFMVEGYEVRGIMYRPVGPTAPLGVVMCDPFAEEKKCAQRTMAETSRALAESGILALHFDYRGTGDSAGEFGQFTLDDWRQDCQAAVDYLRVREGKGRIALLGLRLGASLALLEADSARALAVVMWEPIYDGQKYMRQLLQRSNIKSMLTRPRKGTRAAAMPQLPYFDLDGYRVSRQMSDQIMAMKLQPPPDFAGRVLVVECNPGGEVTPETRALAASLPQAEAQALELEPFWQRLGLVDTGELVAATVRWFALSGEAHV